MQGDGEKKSEITASAVSMRIFIYFTVISALKPCVLISVQNNYKTLSIFVLCNILMSRTTKHVNGLND